MALCNLQGYIYDATGTLIEEGILTLSLQQDMLQDGVKIAPFTISVNLAECNPVGYVNVAVYPTVGATPSGLSYLVEFDPDPTDTSKPKRRKDGYWSNYWAVPQQASVNIGNFAEALRGTPSYSYMPIGGSLSTAGDSLTLGTTPADSTKTLYANQASSNNPGIRFNHTTDLWQVSNNGTNWYDIPTSATGLTASTNFGGDVTGTYDNLQLSANAVGTAELANSGATPGTYGSSTVVPVVTVDAKGRITAISTQTVSTITGAAGGDLSGSYPTPIVIALRGRTVANTTPSIGMVLRWNGSQWDASLDGSGLTGLNASSLTSGTVPLARLSGITPVQFSSNAISQWNNDAGYTTVKESLYFRVSGNAAIGDKQAQALVARDCTIREIRVHSDVAPTGSNLTIRIDKNGTQLHTVTVLATEYAATAAGLAYSVSAGNRLQLDVTAVGSTTPGGNDLLVTIIGD